MPTPASLANLRPWQKGQSGNPAGRPPVGESVAEYIRQKAGEDGRVYVDRLHDIALGSNERLAIQAIGVLLERGYGKPPQDVNLSGNLTRVDPANLARLSDEELALAAALVAKLTASPDVLTPNLMQ